MLLLATLFMMPTIEHDGIKDFPKWTKVISQNAKEIKAHDAITSDWRSHVDQFKEFNHKEQMIAVNDYINHSIKYAEDIDVWHVPDYWATPTEALAKGKGDCEDYAIAKYFSLKQLGFTADEMQITTVVDKDQLHIVLVVDDYVLDSKHSEVIPVDAVYYYQAVFSLNEDHWYGDTREKR